uniref:DUF4283 domain-containing protein n=1 Tax=Cannabis sativa TaxID=3483 RepID=A0A803PHI0_CANSA
MAKRKKPGRTPGTKVALDVGGSEKYLHQERESLAGSSEQLDQFVVHSHQDASTGNVREEVESLKSVRRSWAEEVKNLQLASQHHWQQFSGGKVLNSDAKLSFTELVVRERRKIAHIDLEEVKIEEESWKSSIICMVLGANVPALVLEGFIRRIWGHLRIVQVARMTKGLTMVKFSDEATRDEVLENGMIQLDRKPVIVRPWSTDWNVIRMVKSVPLWIRLPKLGLQYWGKKILSALISTVGIPIMVDKYTKDQTRVQFARVLVEMDITDKPERSFWFVNEYGQLLEHEIEYEWLPVKCKHCGRFEHIFMAECRKVEKQKEVAKVSESKQLTKGITAESVADVVLAAEGSNEAAIEKEVNTDSVQNVTATTDTDNKGSATNCDVNSEAGHTGLNTAEIENKGPKTRGKEISALELEDSKNLIANSSVGPMNRTGSNFTWTNKQDNRIFSRIDHVFHNEDWVDNFPNTPAHFSWDTCSDHCFCVVHSTATENLGTKPFCCYKFWAEHLDYKKTVLDSWGKSLRCCGLKGIYLKTMRLKQKLKRFNRNVIGSIGEAFEKAKESYIEAQFQCQANPNNIYFLGLEHEAENQFHTQEKMYQSFLHQRSNVNWIQKGDSNTTYFHALLKKRKEENRIVSFVTEQGDLNDHFPYVVQHFISHFQGIMGKVKPTSMEIQPDCIALGPKLNLDQQVHLLKPFSLKEVRAAMFSILITKSPGPDGFGSGFFWSVWPEVGKDRHAAIALFFDTNQFPTELHNTTPSLIPKTESPSKAIDYRPFACCTTLYKCVSKLICSRLANVLPNLVSRNQGHLLKAVPLRIIFLFFRIS